MDYYHIVPTEPVEFLRHVISKLTDQSLLIKNKSLIEKIKQSNGKFLDELMTKAPVDLGSIFLRYKPLFLAMRSISNHKRVFNRLRRDAKTMHRPLQVIIPIFFVNRQPLSESWLINLNYFDSIFLQIKDFIANCESNFSAGLIPRLVITDKRPLKDSYRSSQHSLDVF